MTKYVAFLRGINVGGNHKVSMGDLKKELQQLHFENITTILNSGNILFETQKADPELLEKRLSIHLESRFGFPIPCILREAIQIQNLVDFSMKLANLPQKAQVYITFLPRENKSKLELPWENEDQSFVILCHEEDSIISYVDISKSRTPKGMGVLERFYGKNITTRNLNTLIRLQKKLLV